MAPRTWLITGCSSGFGRHLAEVVLERGDRLVATARRPETLDDLVARDPGRVLAVALDVTRPERLPAAVAAAHERFGAVDVLVNNAGFGSVGAVEELEAGHLREVMETMFFGPLALTQAVLPGMRARGRGAIVQISSMGGQLSPPGFGAYCAAKFALEAASESLAAEVAPLGLRVVIVEPGSFRTGFAGGRLHRSPPLAAYAETVGPNREFLTAQDGSQEGDPRRAAEAIVSAVDAPQPPLRLALGADAVEAIRGSLQGRLAELESWEDVSRSTAFA
ncbi:MAG TPA: oxidoreductase [Solirubrobacteraceae bacterium]|nr:oxidoreductase [Solirubrobacteraceae bacterium]